MIAEVTWSPCGSDPQFPAVLWVRSGGQRLRSSVFQDFPWISCSFVVLDLQFRGSDRGQRLRSSVFHDFTWFSCSFVWVRSGVRGSDLQFSKIFVGFTAVLWFWSCSFVGQIGLRRPEFAHLWAFFPVFPSLKAGICTPLGVFCCFSEPEERSPGTPKARICTPLRVFCCFFEPEGRNLHTSQRFWWFSSTFVGTILQAF